MTKDALDLLPFIVAEIHTLKKEAAQMQQGPNAIQAEIAEVAAFLLQHTSEGSIELDSSSFSGIARRTLQ